MIAGTGHDQISQEKRELALEAKDIIESKAFEAAKANLRERLVNTLLTSAPTTERKLELVAQIKVIDEIAGQLKALINDYNSGVRNQARESCLMDWQPWLDAVNRSQGKIAPTGRLPAPANDVGVVDPYGPGSTSEWQRWLDTLRRNMGSSMSFKPDLPPGNSNEVMSNAVSAPPNGDATVAGSPGQEPISVPGQPEFSWASAHTCARPAPAAGTPFTAFCDRDHDQHRLAIPAAMGASRDRRRTGDVANADSPAVNG